MAPQREILDTGMCRAAGLVRPVGVSLMGPTPSPLEFSRFLLSSAGLHLLLAWAVMTVGLYRYPLPDRPLVVRLVEAEAPKPAPAGARSARPRKAEQAAARQADEPAGPKEVAQSDLPLPSAARVDPRSSRAVELIEQDAVDERRLTSPRRVTDDLDKGFELPARVIAARSQFPGGSGVSGPKTIGVEGRIAAVPGSMAGRGHEPDQGLVGNGADTRGLRRRGDAGKGLPGNLISAIPSPSGGGAGRAGRGGGPRGISGGDTVPLPSVGSSSGPTLLGGWGAGEAGLEQAGRGGGSRQLGAAFTAPVAPTVTVGSRQGAGGRRPAGRETGATGGKFAAPNYGANPLPKYPSQARERGYEGTVYLRVLVRPDGRVGSLAIDRSSGHEILDQAAVDSVNGWTFLPAHKGGKPVESWVLLPVKFLLN